jgi:hypothetical protein
MGNKSSVVKESVSIEMEELPMPKPTTSLVQAILTAPVYQQLFTIDYTALHYNNEYNDKLYFGVYHGTPVTIKHYTNDALHLEELQLIKNLRHPNLVLCMGLAHDKQNNQICVVSEFLKDGILNNLLSSTPLTWEHKSKFMLSIIQSMLYLHNSNINASYYMLTSNNVYITRNLQFTKIGNIRFIEYMSQSELADANIQNANWLAPEIKNGSIIFNEKTNVFSFGMILYEIITQKKLGDAPYIFSESEKLSVPPPIIDIYYQCINCNPTKRPTFVTLWKKINSILNDTIYIVPILSNNITEL